MQNFGDVEKYVEEQTNSLGLATDRYAIYLENVEAAQNKATASWEKLVQTTISSGAITGFYNTISILLEIIDSIGGIAPILVTAGLAYVAFTSSISLSSVTALLSIKGLSVGIAGLGATIKGLLATNPVGWAILIVGALVMIANAIPTVQERIDKLNESLREHESNIRTLRDQAKEVDSLSSQYAKLSEEYNKTGKASQEFYDVQNRLKDLIPELNGYYNEHGNFIIDEKENVEALTQAIYDKIAAEKEAMQVDVDRSAKLKAQELEASLKKAAQAAEGYQLVGGGGSQTRVKIKDEKVIEISLDYRNAIEENKRAFAQMSVDAKQAFIDSLKSDELIDMFTELWEAEGRAATDRFMANEKASDMEVLRNEIEQTTIAYDGLSETIKSLTDSASNLQSLMEKSEEGKLSFSDIDELAQAYPEYLNALSMENGQLKLNTDTVREYLYVQAQAKVEAAERTGATETEIAILQAYADQLRSNMYTMLDGVQITTGAFNELLWTIANDAEAAGYQFVDMEGKALTSAQSIHQYLASSDAAFNHFVQQAAIQTGRSAQEVMNIINSMVANTYNNTVAMINSLNGMSTFGMPQNIPALISAGAGSGLPAASSLFSSPPPVYSGSGGGGGSGTTDSSAKDKERDALEAIRELQRAIADAIRDATSALKDQLSAYKKIIDKRKDLLDTLADERRYQQDVENKNKQILKIQNELAALQFDASEEANARRLQLQDELNKAQKELENIQYEESVEDQKDALDKEYAKFEKRINKAIAAIQAINAGSLEEFASALAAILKKFKLPKMHDGGIVGKSSSQSLLGSSSMKPNEVLVKMLKGEGVFTEKQADNFMKNTLPQLAQSTSNYSGGNVDVSMPLQVMGNLDKTVLPDIEKILNQAVERLNKNMTSRGYNRRADQFSI
jgi:hypothetical protein